MSEKELSFDSFMETMDSASGGGKPGFAKMRFFVGWKSLASGLDQNTTFEQYTGEESKVTALATLKKRLLEAQPGIDLEDQKVSPKTAFGIQVYADTVVGGPWAKDMVQVVCNFMDSWVGHSSKKDARGKPDESSEDYKPGIKKYMADLRKSGKLPSEGWLKEYWCKYIWIPDPANRMQAPAPVAEGEEAKPARVKLYVVPIDVFPTKEAMLKAAAEAGVEAGGASNTGAIPTGYNEESWTSYKGEVLTKLENGNWAPPVVKAVAKEYDIPEEWLKANLRQVK